jgi:transposase-like protein
VGGADGRGVGEVLAHRAVRAEVPRRGGRVHRVLRRADRPARRHRAIWPQAIVQLCVVHLIRASLPYAARKYWVPLARDLRSVYTAADEGAAAALEAFAAAWGDRYPAIVRLWRAHWAEFTLFLAFPPEVRRG